MSVAKIKGIAVGSIAKVSGVEIGDIAKVSGAVIGAPVMEMDAVIAIENAQAVPTTLLTTAILSAALKGTPPGTLSYLHHSPLLTTTVVAPAATPMPVPMRAGGFTADGTNANGWRYELTDASPGHDEVWEGFRFSHTVTINNMLMVAYCRLPVAQSGSGVSLNNDWLQMAGDRGYAVPQQIRDAGTNILHGHSQGELGNNIIVDSATDLYEMWAFFDDTNSKGEYALLKGNTVVGASDSLMSGPSGVVNYSDNQSYLSNDGGEALFYALGYKWTSPTYPPRTVTIPAPTSLLVERTNVNEVGVRCNSGLTRFDVERKTGAGAYGALVTNHRIKTTTPAKLYTDGTVANLTTYTYRVRARLGALVSDWVESAPILVDNSSSLTWGGAATPTAVSAVSGPGEEWGVEIVVGAQNVPLTQVGCYFKDSGGGDTTYADVPIRIYDAAHVLVASATVLHAGHTPDAENFVALSYTLLAGQTYFILRDANGYNAFPLSGTRTVNSSLVSIVGPRQNFADGGGNGYCGGINFKT